ncbi:fumarylacetoacetate hydrolase family protein [Geoglobus acetivorans]|uniref:Fumarylacetoacetate hydrolase family protein n=1 Tax=Geoglobus acetivorans TaxID=565033 RepID=A0ABZ3H669_GEOAI|nr:fumarylacetoacetate hydrolase family protein [Geoglobus acetivorans]
MIAYGRFIAGGEIIEDYFEIVNGKIFLDSSHFSIDDVRFLPPVTPEKIIAVGLNYRDHAEELNMSIPDEPVLFMKSPSSIIGDGDAIILPEKSMRVDYEGELAVVIGERCKDVTVKEAEEVVLGYTCFNDVTARDLQQKGWQWGIAKSFDTFSPIGPYIATDIEPDNLKIKTVLNGKVVQESNTSHLIFSVFELVSYVSSIMTLKEGDVISTGTPAGVGKLSSGDVVTVEIENIGKLTNHVR